MICYLSYENSKRHYDRTKEKYDSLLTRKGEIFALTQPGSAQLDKPKVSGGKNNNAMDRYLIEAEYIDKEIREIESILSDRKMLLDSFEHELMKSYELIDQIYICKYIWGMKAERIAERLGYCPAHIYRHLKEIKETIGKL